MYCRWTNDPTRKGRPRRSSDPPTRGRTATARASVPPRATTMRATTTTYASAAHSAQTRVSPTRIRPAPGPGASAVTETPPEVTP